MRKRKRINYIPRTQFRTVTMKDAHENNTWTRPMERKKRKKLKKKACTPGSASPLSPALALRCRLPHFQIKCPQNSGMIIFTLYIPVVSVFSTLLSCGCSEFVPLSLINSCLFFVIQEEIRVIFRSRSTIAGYVHCSVER